jgi:broad specificity phosphatase PhoE
MIRPSRIYRSGKKRAEQTAGVVASALDLCSAWPRAQSDGINPITLWIFVVSRLSSKFVSGRIVGSLLASMVFPEPHV